MSPNINNNLINELILGDKIILKNNFSCLKCTELIFKKEVYQCKNGDWLCKDCWEIVIKSKDNKECGKCKCSVNSFDDLSRLKYIENQFSSNQIYCPYSIKSILIKNNDIINNNNNRTVVDDASHGDNDEYCKEIITISEFENHIKSCKFKLINCSNQGCDALIKEIELNSHKLNCKFNPTIWCSHCGRRDDDDNKVITNESYCELLNQIDSIEMKITDLSNTTTAAAINNTNDTTKYWKIKKVIAGRAFSTAVLFSNFGQFKFSINPNDSEISENEPNKWFDFTINLNKSSTSQSTHRVSLSVAIVEPYYEKLFKKLDFVISENSPISHVIQIRPGYILADVSFKIKIDKHLESFH